MSFVTKEELEEYSIEKLQMYCRDLDLHQTNKKEMMIWMILNYDRLPGSKKKKIETPVVSKQLDLLNLFNDEEELSSDDESMRLSWDEDEMNNLVNNYELSDDSDSDIDIYQ